MFKNIWFYVFSCLIAYPCWATEEVGTCFQGICADESQDAYYQQQGAYSLFSSQRHERQVVSNTGAFFYRDKVYGDDNWFAVGDPLTGGVIPDFVEGALQEQGIAEIFSNSTGFAVLSPLGQFISWGKDISSLRDMQRVSRNHVARVYSNPGAYLLVYEEGSPVPVEIVGDVDGSGTTSDADQIPDSILLQVNKEIAEGKVISAVYANAGSFALLMRGATAPFNGDVIVWGAALSGGVIDGEELSEWLERNDIVSLVASKDAYAAVDVNGQVKSWGGAVANAEVNNLPTGGEAVTRVVAASYSFAALTDSGDIYAWGLAAQLPGEPNELIGKGFTDLYAAERAFVAISKTAMASNYAYAWGEPLNGGQLPTGKMLFPEGDYLLASTANAFLLQAKGGGNGDSKVYLWGNVAFGNTSDSEILDALQWLDIASVTTTNRAFAVLSEQGHVYAWGEPAEGGNIPDYYDPQTGAAVVEETAGAVEFKSEFYDIVAIYASSSLDSITDAVGANVAEFTAIRQDGAVLYWGGIEHGYGIYNP